MAPPPLDPDLARRLAALANVWVHPGIPARKERNARRSHHLRADEVVWVLYDDTLLGGGADGLVLTDARLSTRSTFEAAKPVPYSALGTVRAEEKQLQVAGLTIAFVTWGPSHAEVFVEVLEALRRPEGGRFEDALLREVTHAIGDADETFLTPSIPIRKERTVRALHGLPDEEKVLAIFDDTLLGGARESWVFTDRRLAWKDLFEEPGFQGWGERSTYVPEAPRNLKDHLPALLDAIWAHRALLEPRNPELEARIHAAPDDLEPRLVLADWLLERQHPRGELILLQAEGRDGLDVLQRDPVALGSYDALEVTWRLGFWDTVAIDGGATPWEVPRWLDRVLTHASARFLREVRVTGAPDFEADAIRRGLVRMERYRDAGYARPVLVRDGVVVERT